MGLALIAPLGGKEINGIDKKKISMMLDRSSDKSNLWKLVACHSDNFKPSDLHKLDNNVSVDFCKCKCHCQIIPCVVKRPCLCQSNANAKLQFERWTILPVIRPES